MSYVDGFILAVPRANLDEYKRQATLASTVWLEHGALSYVEAIGDDLPYGDLTSFPRSVQATEDEVVVFAWATYASRESRDAVLQKVFDDPRMKAQMDNMIFDGKRMIYGGFEAFVDVAR